MHEFIFLQTMYVFSIALVLNGSHFKFANRPIRYVQLDNVKIKWICTNFELICTVGMTTCYINMQRLMCVAYDNMDEIDRHQLATSNEVSRNLDTMIAIGEACLDAETE